ncbi:MAG TPA: glycerol-3-phosphate dehydrogenase/oxidase [Chthoniobacter sp.]|jgi:glycerol-3-phosphate dehydrogenase
MNRAEQLERLTSRREPWDILIVGGGATGLGAAVDAASRGHRVALIEQHDFAKGTSSRSTKLVHGGVRYLEQGNLSLVLEALRERGLLLRNAPHLTHALPFVIPCYRWWEAPFYGIGLMLYDALAGRRGLGRTRLLSARKVRERLSTISPQNLKGGVLYFDGQFDDARLALALARTAVAHGAAVTNYVKCTALLKEQGTIVGVRATDSETSRGFEIRARVVINATGVFVDDLRRQDQPDAAKLVRPSQGIHLVLAREFLPGHSALLIPKTSDGRVVFAVPWLGHVILGTTDTPVPDTSLEPRALEEEIRFLLENAARYFTRPPARADILSVYAGLRPLVSHGDDTKTAELSRRDFIQVSASGLITITGGKWTTYRQMGEEVITKAETSAALAGRPCVTPTLALEDDFDNAIAALAAADPELAAPLHPRLPYRRADVVWAAREGLARTVEDVLARRTRALFLDARASIEAADEVAALLSRELAWTPSQTATRANEYREFARGYLLPE